MGTNIQIFNNPKFGEVRATEIDGKTYFVGSDVAKALGYQRPNDAITAHCRYTAKHRISDNQGISRDYLVIPEGDLYRLAAKSQLPGAEAFESWIFDEVLPAIHKHGAYLTPKKTEELLMNPDLIIGLATQLKEERAKSEHLLAENAEVRRRHEEVIIANGAFFEENGALSALMKKRVSFKVKWSELSQLVSVCYKRHKKEYGTIGEVWKRLYKAYRDMLEPEYIRLFDGEKRKTDYFQRNQTEVYRLIDIVMSWR
jgi:prophage antirepressor-like protein